MAFIHKATKYSGLTSDEFGFLRDRGSPIFDQMMRNRIRINFENTLSSSGFYKIRDWCEDHCSKYFHVSDPSYGKAIIYFEDEAEAAAFRLHWHGRTAD